MQNKRSRLLCLSDFFQIFVISRNNEIPIKSNYWLGMYVPYIFKSKQRVIEIPKNYGVLDFE